MIERGDVVLAFIPYVDSTGGGKRRPVVVVQSQQHNQKSQQTIVAAITSQIRNLDDPAVYLLDPSDSEGKASGVLAKSLVRCDRLFTIDQSSIVKKIGHLALGSIDRVEDCLRASLGLPPQSSPSMGNYEKWPGFLRLRDRLLMFSHALALNVTGSAFLVVDLQVAAGDPIFSLGAHDFQIIPPTKKQEFVETGGSIRLTFRVKDAALLAQANAIAPVELEKYPLHRVRLWAHSGNGNNITCVYSGQCLNEGSNEVYLLALGQGLFEVGLNSSGNLLDALLYSDELKLSPSTESSSP